MANGHLDRRRIYRWKQGKAFAAPPLADELNLTSLLSCSYSSRPFLPAAFSVFSVSQSSSMKLPALSCVVVAMLAAFSGCGAISGGRAPGWERRSLFHPNKYPAGEWVQTEVFVEDANFTAADGTKLHGWYAPHEEPKGHALLLHGNGGNVTLLAPTIRILNRRHNLAVLALDYRGFGKSEGKPSENGILQDARAARKWLAAKNKIAESDVILLGQSLGGAVAVDLAATDGCRGLVLASTF